MVGLGDHRVDQPHQGVVRLLERLFLLLGLGFTAVELCREHPGILLGGRHGGGGQRLALDTGRWLLRRQVVGHADAAGSAKTAAGTNGEQIRIQGTLVIIEPDIELTEVTAGGLQEPRREWTTAARANYPPVVKQLLAAENGPQISVYDVPDDTAPGSRLGQVLRLNQEVAMSIAQYSATGSVLATKKDPLTGKPLLDWQLGQGVQEIRQLTGADYALFTYVRDSYASSGRTALRTFALIAGAAMGAYVDIGGGVQVGVASVVDLRTGQVVWHNLMVRQSGDLRDEKGARAAVKQLLEDLPL